MVHPGRIVPATVEIVDIAGLVKGASKGEGLGNKFLANIRETDAIIHVLRCFDDDNIAHVDGNIDPIRDKEEIDAELQLKNLETVESRISKVLKQAQSGDKENCARHLYRRRRENLCRLLRRIRLLQTYPLQHAYLSLAEKCYSDRKSVV